MSETFDSLKDSLQDQSLLWVGLPDHCPVLEPAFACDYPQTFVEPSRPQSLYLATDLSRGSIDEISRKLGALCGPFDAIVLSKTFLRNHAPALHLLKSALLKLCHRESMVIIEGLWLGHLAATEIEKSVESVTTPVAQGLSEQLHVEKILAQVSRMLLRSVHGRAARKNMSAGPSREFTASAQPQARPAPPEDRLRRRWQGQTAKQGLRRTARKIAVLGAGIAGITVALELMQRGHSIEIFEAGPEVLGQGSRQPLLASYPQFARDANSLSLLTQYSLRLLKQSPYLDLLRFSGRFHPALSPVHEQEQKELVTRLGLDPSLLRHLDSIQARSIWSMFDHAASGESTSKSTSKSTQASSSIANASRRGGLWIELGAQLEVDRLRERVLLLASDASNRLTLHLTQEVSYSELKEGFAAVVVATGRGTPAWLTKTKPQNTFLAEACWKEYLGSSFSVTSSSVGALSGIEEFKRPAGYSTSNNLPIFGGPVSLQSFGKRRWLLGSSYFEASTREVSLESQWQLLIEGARALIGSTSLVFEKVDTHSGARCSVKDRMPLIGPLFEQEMNTALQLQPYLATAFGSRGLLWAHLAAQLIADHIDGISPRIGLKALKSIDPFRFTEKHSQKSLQKKPLSA
jgi:tRNA 5-methylaminomethyl-2-thiouridine biosynthesis bifunctional protein